MGVRQVSWRRGVWEALGLALALLPITTAVFGRPIVGHLGSRVLGVGRDPQVFIWALAWWPHALAHAQDALTTHAVWAPGGYDVLWSTTVPGLSLLALPLTLTFGPTVAYNVLALAAPALAGGAVHLLCRGLGARAAACAAAGLLFAVGPYEAATMSGHLHLSFAAPGIVAAALVVWGSTAARRGPWIAATAVVLAFQFLVAPELFVTFVAAGAVALALTGRLTHAGPAVLRAAKTISLAGVAGAIVITSPLFLHMALHGPGTLFRPGVYSVDLLGLVVPTALTELRPPFADGIVARFHAGAVEQPAYLGPLLALLVLSLALRRDERARFAAPLAFLAVAVVASLGPFVDVAGTRTEPLPMALAARLPLLGNVLPSRIALFVWIGVGVIVALWLSRGRWWRWAVFAAALISVAPAVTRPSSWYAPNHTGTVFAERRDDVIHDGERVLVLPMEGSDVLRRQAEDGFRFTLAGGMPPEPQYYDERKPPEVRAFIERSHPDVVVVDARDDARYRRLLVSDGLLPRVVAGAVVYRPELRQAPNVDSSAAAVFSNRSAAP